CLRVGSSFRVAGSLTIRRIGCVAAYGIDNRLRDSKDLDVLEKGLNQECLLDVVTAFDVIDHQDVDVVTRDDEATGARHGAVRYRERALAFRDRVRKRSADAGSAYRRDHLTGDDLL